MKIVIIEPLGIDSDVLESLRAKVVKDGDEFVAYDTRVTDEATLIERGHDADIIVVANLPLNANVINGFDNLKYLAIAFTGVDHVDLAACKAKGVQVSNAAGYSTAAVADLVFGLVIDLYRHIDKANELTRESKTKAGLSAFEIEGKKFGVLGTGAIGLRVASIAHAFGAEVYAYSRTVKDIPYIKYVDKETLFRECDIVSVHTPLNNETRGLVGEKELGLMKKSALLINTARGPVVDQTALYNALINNQIAGAGVDVYEVEPPISAENPLLKTTNTILTPHLGFYTKEALVKRAIIVFDNIKAYLEGNPTNLVNL